MQFHQLRTFATAAECQGFTRAAETLGITQAAVSQHIASLEKELGVRLFHRQSRRVSLSDEGRRLYPYAVKILELVQQAVDEVSRSKTALRGTLRIAASTAPAAGLLSDLLAEFHRRFPEVRETVMVSDSQAAIEAVTTGQADVGLVGELPRANALDARPIASDELVLVVAPRHALAKKKGVSIADLRNEPLIVREPGSGTRHCLEQALESHGLSLRELTIALEVNSNEAIRAAVERGVGIAFVSSNTIARGEGLGKMVPIKMRGFRPRRYLYVITDPNRVLAAPVRQFIALLEEGKPRPTRRRADK